MEIDFFFFLGHQHLSKRYQLCSGTREKKKKRKKEADNMVLLHMKIANGYNFPFNTSSNSKLVPQRTYLAFSKKTKNKSLKFPFSLIYLFLMLFVPLPALTSHVSNRKMICRMRGIFPFDFLMLPNIHNSKRK